MVDLEVYGFIYVIGAKLNYKFTFHFPPKKPHFNNLMNVITYGIKVVSPGSVYSHTIRCM